MKDLAVYYRDRQSPLLLAATMPGLKSRFYLRKIMQKVRMGISTQPPLGSERRIHFLSHMQTGM